MLLLSCCLFTAIETLTKTDFSTRDWDIVAIDLTMFLFGGIWTLVFWVRKAVGCFKHCLMGHTSRIIEDVNCGGLTQEVSEKKNFSMLPRNHSCDILAKNIAYFCHCPKSLPKAKVKSLY